MTRTRSSAFPWILAILLLGALIWGLEQVVYAPLETGESYPEFSTLRSDPLGARALYESLAELPGLRVDRLYKERPQLEPDETLLVLGISSEGFQLELATSKDDFSAKERILQQYEDLVHNGGRLVLGFMPARTPGIESKRTPPIVTHWQIELKYRPDMSDYSKGGTPGETALYFVPRDSSWKILTQSGDKVETVERRFGKGTIVLAADTFPLSNQGLHDHHDARFIAMLVGASTHVVFDENHFGVEESGSVVKLMRRYRLHGAIAVLLAVATLFLWRASSSLLPPRSAGASRSSVAGRDSLEGLASLLHRGVPEKQLLDTCFNEWSKSVARSAHATRAEQIRAEIAAHPDSPVDAYQAACRILTQNPNK